MEKNSLILKFGNWEHGISDDSFQSEVSDEYTFVVLSPMDSDRNATTPGPWAHLTNFYLGELD